MAGALDYITKPALLGEIRSRIQRALEKRDLLLQNRFYQQNLERLVDQQAEPAQGAVPRRGADPGAGAGCQGPLHPRAIPAGSATTPSGSRTRMGFSGQALEDIRLGAELHDIGKIGTREAVLRKPGPLTPDEFSHITEHTVLGERILAPLARANPAGAVHRPVPSRAGGRRRLSRPAGGQPHPLGGAHRGGGRCLRRHDHRPVLPHLAPAPVGAHRGTRAAAPAAISTRCGERRSARSSPIRTELLVGR